MKIVNKTIFTIHIHSNWTRLKICSTINGNMHYNVLVFFMKNKQRTKYFITLWFPRTGIYSAEGMGELTMLSVAIRHYRRIFQIFNPMFYHSVQFISEHIQVHAIISDICMFRVNAPLVLTGTAWGKRFLFKRSFTKD